MTDFPLTPSDDYVRIKAAADAARAAWLAALDPMDCRARGDEYAALQQALAATPEGQFLAEMEGVEGEAWQLRLDADARRAGRMTSVLWPESAEAIFSQYFRPQPRPRQPGRNRTDSA